MSKLYFSIIETVENEYAVEMSNEEIERYLNSHKLIKPSEVDQWLLEDKLEFKQILEHIQDDYTTLKITGLKND